MITSYEVGAIFKLVDSASPTLRSILAEVRKLNLALDKARENLATIGRGATVGLGSAVGETQALAGAWREVAAASAMTDQFIEDTVDAAAGLASFYARRVGRRNGVGSCCHSRIRRPKGVGVSRSDPVGDSVTGNERGRQLRRSYLLSCSMRSARRSIWFASAFQLRDMFASIVARCGEILASRPRCWYSVA